MNFLTHLLSIVNSGQNNEMEISRKIIEKRAKVHAPQRKNCNQTKFECLSSHGKIIQKCKEMKIAENSKKTKENGNLSSSKRRLNDRSSSESGNDSLSDREGETSIPSKNSRYENGTVQSSAENVNIDNKQDIINSSFGKEVEITTYQINHNLDNLPEDIYEPITKHLSDDDILKLFFLNIFLLNILKSANGVLKKLTLRLDRHNFETFNNYTLFYDVQLRNIVFDFKDFINLSKPVKFLENFVSTIENLHIKNAKFKSFIDFSRFCSRLRNIKILKFENCGIDQLGNNFLPELLTLNQISFHKCNDLMYKAFKNQTSLTKIEVSNQDWTWNGFPHETLNEICKNCKKLDHIVLSGAGTGSYFDADEFPYKIRHLESTMITFHWYVGIKSARVSFLESQKGFLKDLRIHQLPNDFDGGRVLNYIFKEMNLNSFIYGDIPLILKGQKQQPTGFSATEIQIKAAIELIAQFPSITSYCLILSATDIASDEIEKAINPRNTVFHQLKKFEVIDNSKYRGLFGVFLGLLKNLINIEVLSLKTQDRNINVLLEESLPYMTEIKEIYLPSMASRGKERLNIIKNKAPTLKKLSIANQFVEEAKIIFGNSVEICGITA